jgi:hypothetical protein
MGLMMIAKDKMQGMRSQGCEQILAKVASFCNTFGIELPFSGENYVPHGRSLRFYDRETNDDHFRRQVILVLLIKLSKILTIGLMRLIWSYLL